MITSVVKHLKRNRGMAVATLGLGCFILIPASPLFIPACMTLVTVGVIISED